MNALARPLMLTITASLALAGCELPPSAQPRSGATALAVAVDPPCNVTQASFNHIHSRHCTPASGADQLAAQYCTQAGMQTFCGMIQAAPAASSVRVVQADGRIRYDANLGIAVGTAGQRCGRLVITSIINGEVITEFPENAGPPTPPAC